MSLSVPAGLLDRALDGDVADAEFLDCVATSLPYAWNLVLDLVGAVQSTEREFADNQVPPPDEAARGQLLRLMASDAMRSAIERRYGVTLAFQNCHRVAVFRPGAGRALERFRSPRAQLLNQRPEFVNC